MSEEPKIKLAVVSSSCFWDRERLFKILDKAKHKISFILCPNTQGAGELADEWATENKIDKVVFYANKERDGSGCAIKRANKLVRSCDFLFVFWDKESSGAKLYLSAAEKYKKKYKIYNFNLEE
jgi:hypothetical protein